MLIPEKYKRIFLTVTILTFLISTAWTIFFSISISDINCTTNPPCILASDKNDSTRGRSIALMVIIFFTFAFLVPLCAFFGTKNNEKKCLEYFGLCQLCNAMCAIYWVTIIWITVDEIAEPCTSQICIDQFNKGNTSCRFPLHNTDNSVINDENIKPLSDGGENKNKSNYVTRKKTFCDAPYSYSYAQISTIVLIASFFLGIFIFYQILQNYKEFNKEQKILINGGGSSIIAPTIMTANVRVPSSNDSKDDMYEVELKLKQYQQNEKMVPLMAILK